MTPKEQMWLNPMLFSLNKSTIISHINRLIGMLELDSIKDRLIHS
jgi:ABC-type Na+ transport system ATPase subunit NatA